MDWANLWNKIKTFFSDEVFTIKNLINIAVFFAILIIGIIVIKIILSVVRKLLSKTKMEKIAQQFICTILKFLLWLVLILLLLSQIGVQITGILTAFSAVILAVGMALQNAIANVANGIIIISNKMFKKGDYIIINGVEGNITDINFMFTTIITVDNKKITLPNSSIVNGTVTNLGAYPKRRVDLTFSVAYESDVELVKKIVTDVMKSDGRVYLDPEPFCRLKVLNSSSIDFFANCWCDNADYWDVYYYLVENVYNEFKRNKISVPYNQIEFRERKDNVKMPVNGKKLPARVEKVRPKEESKDIESLITGHFSKKSKEEKKAKKEKQLKEKELKKEEKAKAAKAETKAKVEKKSEKKNDKKVEKKSKK